MEPPWFFPQIRNLAESRGHCCSSTLKNNPRCFMFLICAYSAIFTNFPVIFAQTEKFINGSLLFELKDLFSQVANSLPTEPSLENLKDLIHSANLNYNGI